MSASLSASPGGQPSTTAPIAGPWLSPQVVKRNTRPKLLKLIVRRPPSSRATMQKVVALSGAVMDVAAQDRQTVGRGRGLEATAAFVRSPLSASRLAPPPRC